MCLGAHPDDIEFGASARLVHLAETNPDTEFHFAIVAGTRERRNEAIASAKSLFSGRATIQVGSFTDGFVPYESVAEAKRFVSSCIPPDGIDMVVAPQQTDLREDHRFVGEIARQLFRDQMILEYEIAKLDGGLVSPNVYFPVSKPRAEAKVIHIMESFPSQKSHSWFSEDAVLALMRLRGIESNAPEGFAEAFVSSKIVIS